MPTSAGTERSDITARLLGRIKELMSAGVLRPGCKVPPERELARMFGVSRSSLRQALKFLDLIGLLIQKVGDGSYLTTRGSAILSEPLDLLIRLEGIGLEELIEARLIVEPELAAKAAERATSEDLRTIKQTLVLMRTHANDNRTLVEQDVAFHRAIHRAARNRICESVFAFVHRSVGATISLANQLVDVRHTLKFHRRVFEAIRDRDPVEARRAMAEHLRDVRTLLARARAQVNLQAFEGRIHPVTARGGKAETNGASPNVRGRACSTNSVRHDRVRR